MEMVWEQDDCFDFKRPFLLALAESVAEQHSRLRIIKNPLAIVGDDRKKVRAARNVEPPIIWHIS